MTFQELEKALIKGKRILKPINNGTTIEKKEGYYSIWISDPKKMPAIFYEELVKRKTSLIYIGIASGSLYKRLYLQELQHRNAATFFRSIGAVLGYRPEPGTLVGKRNQNNYKFSQEHTKAIVEWINDNLEIAFHYGSTADSSIEKMLIAKYKPLLNWTHNPEPFMPLKYLKDECRFVARNNKKG
jgi:hypothetical protein